MRLLFIGDVNDEEGVRYLTSNIEEIKKKCKMNIVITNGENAAEGKDITQKLNKEFIRMGVNFLIKRLINYYKISIIR